MGIPKGIYLRSDLEAGHPSPMRTFATAEAIKLKGPDRRRHSAFLISGGGSALFEKPLVADEVLKDLTEQLLPAEPTSLKSTPSASGSRRSKAVNSPSCVNRRKFLLVLSDIIGDPST